MILYKINKYGIRIEEINATRISDKSYWYMRGGRELRSAIINEWERVFESKDEACEHMIEREKSLLAIAENEVIRRRDNIAELDAMKEELQEAQP